MSVAHSGTELCSIEFGRKYSLIYSDPGLRYAELLFCLLWADTGKHVCRSVFSPTHFWNIWFGLELEWLLAVPVSQEIVSDFSFVEKGSFGAGVSNFWHQFVPLILFG